MDLTPGISGSSAPRTILVVDDEPYLRDLIGDYLRARGCEVVEAENGLEALMAFRLVRPQAVVLDLLMPRLGGLRALQRIRASDKTIAVIVVTGTVDGELRREVLAAGATAILTKPIHLNDLWSALGGSEGLPDRPPGTRLRSAALAAAAGVSQGHILIVDDEEEVRSSVEHLASRQGYAVRTAADGDLALRAIKEDPPEVVLLDIQMPGLTGVDALTAIHQIAPHIKVIMMSGAASFELARETLVHGAFDFIPKPLDMKALVHTLQAAFLMRRLEAEWPVKPEAGP